MDQQQIQGWFNVAEFVITVLSFMAAIYFYLRSRERRVPTFGVDPFRVRLVDKTEMTAPGLEISHNGVPLGNQNVTVMTIHFGNAGRAAIRKDHVLKPYKIRLDGDATMLDRKIVASTRDVCKFVIQPNPRNDNEIELGFDIVEASDAVTIQVLFSGDPNVPVVMEGVCEGARQVKLKEQGVRMTGALVAVVMSAIIVFIGGIELSALPARHHIDLNVLSGGRADSCGVFSG